jgi:hypothetical protein
MFISLIFFRTYLQFSILQFYIHTVSYESFFFLFSIYTLLICLDSFPSFFKVYNHSTIYRYIPSWLTTIISILIFTFNHIIYLQFIFQLCILMSNRSFSLSSVRKYYSFLSSLFCLYKLHVYILTMFCLYNI